MIDQFVDGQLIFQWW